MKPWYQRTQEYKSNYFPPVNSGGLIEAVGGEAGAARPVVGFPPVNSGGLIEAILDTEASDKTPVLSAGEFRRPH